MFLIIPLYALKEQIKEQIYANGRTLLCTLGVVSLAHYVPQNT